MARKISRINGRVGKSRLKKREAANCGGLIVAPVFGAKKCKTQQPMLNVADQRNEAGSGRHSLAATYS